MLLGWTRDKLKVEVGIELHAIAAFEKTGRVSPFEAAPASVDRLAAIRATLEATGTEFTTAMRQGCRCDQLNPFEADEAAIPPWRPETAPP